MTQTLQAKDLPSLYEQDETAWLEISAELVANRRFEELDSTNLAEYLQDMAKRDRREVVSRLRILLSHLLKWEQQAELRTPSWRLTILNQRRDLADILSSGTLRRHAEQELAKAYRRAVEMAEIETGLAEESFPKTCPFTLETALSDVE